MTDQPDGREKPLCFVIGPIGSTGSETRRTADLFLRSVVRVALGSRFTIKRADEDKNPGEISTAMISDLGNAPIVVADLTGHNANCLYELGVRHTLGKPVVYMSRDEMEPPFDIGGQRLIRVDINRSEDLDRASFALQEAVDLCLQPGFVQDNPVSIAEMVRKASASGDGNQRIVGALLEKMSALEAQIRDLPAASFSGNDLRTPEKAYLFAKLSAHADTAIFNLKTAMTEQQERQALADLNNVLREAGAASLDLGITRRDYNYIPLWKFRELAGLPPAIVRSDDV